MKKYRNIAFLAELLINILVFSISCAILAGVFGKAGVIARQTREESQAGIETYALIEITKARGLQQTDFVGSETQAQKVYLYDENWKPLAQGQNAAYTVELRIVREQVEAGVLEYITAVAVNASGAELCRLETAVYRPAEGGV